MDASGMSYVVNTRSGGFRGQALMQALQGRFGANLVHDLATGGLDARIQAWQGRIRAVIACGGDGTVATVLEATRAYPSLSVGIIPLGTGNDLARVTGQKIASSWEGHVAALAGAVPVSLDRWLLSGPNMNRVWYNYASFGGDARIAGRFHAWRTQHPKIFRSILANQIAYAAAGLQEMGSQIAVEVVADGGVAQRLRGTAFVVLNIPSYAGGRLRPAQVEAQDGYCDAFVLGGGLRMGLTLAGLLAPQRSHHARRLLIRVDEPTFVQVDGEPMPAAAGIYTITTGGSARLLVMPGGRAWRDEALPGG